MVQDSSAGPAVAAIVLAAGGSSRMPELKQLLPLGGRPMVRWATEAACAAGLAQVVVVVGAQADAVERALAGLPAEVVRNERWAEGLSTSVQAGLRALRPGTQAALMLLADQPGVRPGLLRALVDGYRASGAPIVVPAFRGRRGNPVLFDRSLFPELMAVEGDRGGRVIIARHESAVHCLEVDDAAVISDVDTHQDYEQARSQETSP
jgi:molybdenum cofactor cytidylyltransferase